jgi:hypothetical protein
MMLAQLVALLESQESALSLAEISRRLQAQPTAILAMIDYLVQKGRLVEFGPDGTACSGCGEQPDCNLLSTFGKRYAAASRLTEITGRGACLSADR